MYSLLVTFGLILLVTVQANCSDVSEMDEKEIKKILQQQSKDIDALIKIVGEQNDRLGEQNDRIRKLELDNAALRRADANRAQQCQQLQHGLENHINKRILLNHAVGSNPKTAFTARLSQHVTGLGNNQAVVFEDVVSNSGNAYSPVTGVFTSPINGTYFFFASIMTHQSEYIETEIVRNGVREALMYGYGNTAYDQGANAAVIGLNAGDKVWVRHVGTQGSKVLGGSWSSFSGFQI